MNSQTSAAKNANEEIDFLSVARAAWRGKFTILACTTLFASAGFFISVSATPQYRASASLVMEIDKKNLIDIESIVSGTSGDRTALNTEMEILRSRDIIKKLVLDLGLISDPEFNAALRPDSAFSRAKSWALSLLPMTDAIPEHPSEGVALNNTIAAVRKSILISILRDTYIFSISATTSSPIKSARISNRLVEIYISNQIDVKFQAAENAIIWLSERVAELESELKEKEDSVKELRANANLVSIEDLEALNARAKSLRDRIDRSSSEILRNKQLRADVLTLIDSSENFEEISRRLNDPILNNIFSTKDGSEWQEAFVDRVERVLGQNMNALSLEQSQLLNIERSLKSLEAQISEQSEEFLRIQQLERETEATRTLYETFLNRLKEASVQRGIQQADSRMLSEATPGVRVSPNTNRIVVLSAMLGVLCGAGIAYLRNLMKNGFRTSEELQSLANYQVLGAIPVAPVSKRSGLLAFLNENPTSAMVEAIRNLRTSIFMMDPKHPPQIVMMTSSIPGEGKTTSSLALAKSAHDMGKKVLLIEADIRRRAFGEHFHVPEGQLGLAAALSHGIKLDTVIYNQPDLDFDIILGEQSLKNAADVFASQAFGDLLTHLRNYYDFILIDTPPVLVVTDARIIGQYVDAILYNVKWDSTSQAQVKEGLRQMTTAGLKISGLILNQVDVNGMRSYGYGADYGSYANLGNRYYG